MVRRRVGALAEYKRERRARQRAAAKGNATPVQLARAAAMQCFRDGTGEYRVWRAGVQLAGPFDTREEGQEWIDDQMTDRSS